MMKRFCTVLLMLLTAVCALCGFAACNGGTGDTPHTHDFGGWEVVTEATCTEAGEERRTCSCGETETQAVDPLGHDFRDGICTRCGESDLPATDSSYFEFTELDDGTYSIAWKRDTELPAVVALPAEYNGRAVTSIGQEAFYVCSGLTEITIPDSITSIEYGAFMYCRNLTELTIPNSVTAIGEVAFLSCESLTEITIPDSVISIGREAFGYCTGLMQITIPDSVTSIELGAFMRCESLTQLTIAASVTCIDSTFSYVFDRCPNLTQITISDGGTSIGTFLSGCTSVTQITIPDSITSIGTGAFYGCTSLTQITIPAGVTQIGLNPFVGCISMTDLTVDPNNPYYHMDGNCLIKTDTKILISGFADSVIPTDESVTSIGWGAFGDCSGLTEITIPDSVTSIEEMAFYDCPSLTHVYFEQPEGWTSEGKSIPAEELADPELAAEFLTWGSPLSRAD